MKLRNKLIPLASVFATGAVIAPCVLTSCSANGQMVDLSSGNYAPTINKAKTEGYVADEDLAMTLLMSSVTKDPEVFIQDRYWCDSALIKGFADLASINVTSIKGQCKNVSVKYVTIKDGEVDKKIPTVSMTYTLAVEANWSVTGNDEVPISHFSEYAKTFGAPLYYPIVKYYYDEDVAGKIYSNYAYEATWTNIPLEIYDIIKSIQESVYESWGETPTEAEIKSQLPKILTEVTSWTLRPSLTLLQMMDDAKLDWNYSVQYAKEDTFVFDKQGVETSKVSGSTLDRKYHKYTDLISGPTEAQYYTIGAQLLKSESIASYYLSDLKKAE